MKRLTLTFCCLTSLTIAIVSCNAKTGDKKATTVTAKDNAALNGAVIKNNIDVDVSGAKLSKIFLVDESLTPLTENKVALGQKIYLEILMDTGWVKENGKSFIGASERILTSDGRVVVSADDIFKDQESEGMNAKDAKDVSLSAMITSPDGNTNDFEVQFRVWDKRSSAEVKGKYFFSLKK